MVINEFRNGKALNEYNILDLCIYVKGDGRNRKPEVNLNVILISKHFINIGDSKYFINLQYWELKASH